MAIESLNEDDSPLIYGLEFQARSLCSTSNGDSSSFVRFLVGTQSLKNENQIHLLEYLDENNTLSKTVFRHSSGEVWHVSTHCKHPNLISTCYSSQSPTHAGKVDNHCSLWTLPIDMSAPLTDEDSTTLSQLSKVSDLEVTAEEGIGRTSVWHPEDGHQIINFAENKLYLWDVESHKNLSTINADFNVTAKSANKFNKITTFRWSPHSNCGLIGVANSNYIYAKDLRIKSSSGVYAWTIPNAHSQLVRDLDFNPNAQYYLSSCGDDCETRFWDVRNTSAPVLSVTNHSHWVWSVRYNLFHDQLVLTSSSDSRVVLMRAVSVASQPFGHLLEDESPEDDNGVFNKTSMNTDGIIATFEEHEDSVYSVEWSVSDPWIFASLSYDGRLVINKVPKIEKFNILF
ncbi:EARP-interacting protein homolog [Oppia nitens]|uniref:EARP-interacting protein homolog n=1 Tax=Oppia nitens TaxID=1686743 RepID=UPI0023D97A7C|nr:EARP-interacting protein homolog [Oppia nitens]